MAMKAKGEQGGQALALDVKYEGEIESSEMEAQK